MIIGIIGAGASGMAAALAAAENPNVQVVLMERQARVGRKLQATGNGRCNLSNIYAGDGKYHGQKPGFADYAIKKFTPEQTISWFRSLGLYTVTEVSGKVYPYSDQANSVVDVLRLALQERNIQLITGFEVEKVKADNNKFTVSNGDESICCDKLIIACGGVAGTKLGGNMSGYKLLAKLGHKSCRLRPALVQLKSGWNGVVALKGVRANCHVRIYRDKELFNQSIGELQFTDYGISGPVVFEISRDVCSDASPWSAILDFLPEITESSLVDELKRRKNTNLLAEELFTGIIHNRLGRVLAKSVGINLNQSISSLTDENIMDAAKAVKCFELTLRDTMGMDCAQVTAGGVLTDQFNCETMESKLVPGLYACGEVLDIDGDCGGFNLQWAWSSGRLAGLSAGKGL